MYLSSQCWSSSLAELLLSSLSTISSFAPNTADQSSAKVLFIRMKLELQVLGRTVTKVVGPTAPSLPQPSGGLRRGLGPTSRFLTESQALVRL